MNKDVVIIKSLNVTTHNKWWHEPQEVAERRRPGMQLTHDRWR
jgi:hypothetical protein